MKIYHFNKAIASALILVTFMTLLSLPIMAARERRGSTVVVAMADGRLVSGELLAVKSDALWIYDHDAGRGENLDLRQVTHVKVLKKARVLQGLAMGLGAGILLSIMTPHDHDMDEWGIQTHVCLPVLISCLGGIIGNQASMPKGFSLAGAGPLTIKEKLGQLKRFARDRDPAREE